MHNLLLNLFSAIEIGTRPPHVYLPQMDLDNGDNKYYISSTQLLNNQPCNQQPIQSNEHPTSVMPPLTISNDFHVDTRSPSPSRCTHPSHGFGGFCTIVILALLERGSHHPGARYSILANAPSSAAATSCDVKTADSDGGLKAAARRRSSGCNMYRLIADDMF
jgi:hypothetical protein